MGTTEENLKQHRDGKAPQLQAPRPKELQKILLEHQRSFTKDVNEKETEIIPEDNVHDIEDNTRLVMMRFLKYICISISDFDWSHFAKIVVLRSNLCVLLGKNYNVVFSFVRTNPR